MSKDLGQTPQTCPSLAYISISWLEDGIIDEGGGEGDRRRRVEPIMVDILSRAWWVDVAMDDT